MYPGFLRALFNSDDVRHLLYGEPRVQLNLKTLSDQFRDPVKYMTLVNHFMQPNICEGVVGKNSNCKNYLRNLISLVLPMNEQAPAS